MICLYLAEDVTPGVQYQRDWETPGGIAPLAECMFMGQRYDMAVIYVTHTLSGTSPIIRQNAQTIIVTNASGENPRLVCDTLAVTPEQAEKIKTLRPGEFAILNPVLWDKCVYATFEKLQIPGKLQEPERRRAVEKFLAKVKTCAPAPLGTFRPVPSVKTTDSGSLHSVGQKLTSSDIEMLVHAGTGSPKPIGIIYGLMGLSRTQGRRIAKRLEPLGAIVLHAIATGRRGGRLCFAEVTDFGWQILQGKGITKPQAKTNGTFLHELAARLIEVWERKRSRVVIFEVDVGGKRVDAVSMDRTTGAKTIWQIGVTDAAREADSIEAIAELPVMQTSDLVFVARSPKLAKEVARLLKAKDPSGGLLNRVETKMIADFVEM
jgi:hypothetical protein